MEFKLEPNNIGQPDEELLADLRRVSALVQPASLTKDRYDELGRWCAATMRKRFGNWNLALERTGIQPSKRMNIRQSELLDDLKAVAKQVDGGLVTRDDYREFGKFSEAALSRAFGSWNQSLRAAELPVGFAPKPLTEERCFEAIEMVWRRFGRQPRQTEVRRPEATVSGTLIARRLGSWRKALEAFVAFVNAPSPRDCARPTEGVSEPKERPVADSEPQARSARTAGWRLRFLVMRRDRFTCRKCGRSPSNHPGLALVIDHVTAWSKGGRTTFDNLQTLCEPCNGGRGNLDLEA